MFVSMTAAAMKIDKIRLGTGVMIPTNRLSPVAASALASLNALAPGRIDMGVGTGFTGRRTMGLGPIKLADMFDYIDVIEKLLAGEMVEAEIEGALHPIRFMNPELELINIRTRCRYVSALGPRGRNMVAQRGYGWINTVGRLDRAQAAIDDMKKSWTDAGRDVNDLEASATSGGAILKIRTTGMNRMCRRRLARRPPSSSQHGRGSRIRLDRPDAAAGARRAGRRI